MPNVKVISLEEILARILAERQASESEPVHINVEDLPAALAQMQEIVDDKDNEAEVVLDMPGVNYEEFGHAFGTCCHEHAVGLATYLNQIWGEGRIQEIVAFGHKIAEDTMANQEVELRHRLSFIHSIGDLIKFALADHLEKAGWGEVIRKELKRIAKEEPAAH